MSYVVRKVISLMKIHVILDLQDKLNRALNNRTCTGPVSPKPPAETFCARKTKNRQVYTPEISPETAL